VQHQWNENVIKAQRYIYTDNIEANNILVGSSLSNRLSQELLPKNYFNLALSGRGIFDGLEIINNTSKTPESVFVETNVLLRNQDVNFVKSLFNPVSLFLKENFLILRAENQPAALIGNNKCTITFFNNILGLYRNETRKMDRCLSEGVLKRHRGSEEMSEDVNISKENYEFMLKRKILEYSEPPNKEFLNTQLETLKNYMEVLEKRDIQIIFFEMPVHRELCNLPRPRLIRDAIKLTFPRNKFIPHPDCREYSFTDGVHLDLISARKYIQYFMDYSTSMVRTKAAEHSN